MLNLNERTRLMNRVIKRSKDMLLEEGSIYPMLILYSKGKPLSLNEEEDKHPGVILLKNSEGFEVVSDEFIADDGERIYTSHVVFSYGDGIDERDMNRASKLLTKKYKPDMVGFVMSCLYTDNAKENGGAVQSNPEVSRVVHSVFYTPAIRDGKVIFIPYLNRGELPVQQKTASNGISDAINYDVTFFDSGWSSSKGKSVRPSIGNPYPRS